MKLQQLHESDEAAVAWVKKNWADGTGELWKPLKTGETGFRRSRHDDPIIVDVVVHGSAVNVYCYERGWPRATPPKEKDIIHLGVHETPPFKIDVASGVVLVYSVTDVSKLPEDGHVNGIVLDSQSWTTVKGISRRVKTVGVIELSEVDVNLSGMLELAMITYTSKLYGWIVTSNHSDYADVRKAAKLIIAHVKEYGPGQKILDLRKQLIEAGLEKHL